MASNNANKDALNQFKMEAASEVGVQTHLKSVWFIEDFG